MYIFMPIFREILNMACWPVFLSFNYFLPEGIFPSVFFKSFHISVYPSVLQAASVFIAKGGFISVAMHIPNLICRWAVRLKSSLVPFSRAKDNAKRLSRMLSSMCSHLFLINEILVLLNLPSSQKSLTGI